MNYNFFKNYNIFLLFFTLYLSLVVGFYFDENLNYGAIPDWSHTDFPVIKDLSVDTKKTLLDYESYGHRHSPVYLIFLSLFRRIGFSFEAIRFLHLNISLLLIYFFYKCLLLKFNNVEKNILLVLSLSIFLSPTFRSLAIWPSSRLVGLIFFVISSYEFLKFLNKPKKVYMWKNIIFLIISSYISPNFSLFIIFFLFHYLKKVAFKDLLIISLFCFVSSIPAFYYIFVLDINFLLATTPGIDKSQTISLSFNLSDKILIISSILFFHLIPFLIDNRFIKSFIKHQKRDVLIVGVFLIINLFFFGYSINFTGGGVFFQLSNFFFENNYFFYLVSFISLMLIANFSKNSFSNFLIFILIIISNIQNTIYHKYYDPLIMILFFILINNSLSYDFFKYRNKVFYVYIFYLIYILMRIVKNNYFNL